MAEKDRMTPEEVVATCSSEPEAAEGETASTPARVAALDGRAADGGRGLRADRRRARERTEDRATHRNGYRQRRWYTRASELELAIPKLRKGSYFPSFLQLRKRSELAVVQEAYVAGVSTRKVDQVVESLGLRVSKSEVSRICAGFDEQVEAFRGRPLEGRYPYLFLDTKVERVRETAGA